MLLGLHADRNIIYESHCVYLSEGEREENKTFLKDRGRLDVPAAAIFKQEVTVVSFSDIETNSIFFVSLSTNGEGSRKQLTRTRKCSLHIM